MWSAGLIIGIWALFVPGTYGQTSCKTPWREINGRCFLSAPANAVSLPTHLSRQMYCQGQRGSLAKFDPPAVYQASLSIFVTELAEFYIGLTDLAQEGDFRWSLDNTMPSINLALPWAPGQPDGGTTENCVIVSGDPAAWSDTSCEQQLPFICERRVDNPPCGAGPFATRILGGTPTTPGVWPWQGSINGQCGATLISEEWAVTAAHCLTVGNSIFFGEISQSPPSSTRQSSDITWFMDPRYNFTTNEYDLALVYLHTPVSFNNFVQPACVYESEAATPANDLSPPEVADLAECYISGWGNQAGGAGSAPNILQEAPVTLFQPGACGAYGDRFKPRVHLCAGDLTGAVDACQGDSGGPLVCKERVDPLVPTSSTLWTLAGVVSFGAMCGLEGFPGVYTRLSTTRSFVDETRLTDNLFRCGNSGAVILNAQVCNSIVDCPDYSDELGCRPLQVEDTALLQSPKFDQVTNFIRRDWIYIPAQGRTLTVSFSLNSIILGGLTATADLQGAVPQTVPPRNPIQGNPFVFIGTPGQPVVISMDKRSINDIAGFQATIIAA